MLKITTVDAGQQRTLALEGKLVTPWLAELAASWRELQSAGAGELVLDLRDVTVISLEGEELLLQMMNEGVRINCCRGILTKNVLSRLEQRRKEEGKGSYGPHHHGIERRC